MDFLTRARVRADVGAIARRSREAVDLLLNVNGASSFAETNPAAADLRDLEVCTRQAVVNAEISEELYGRALLGVKDPRDGGRARRGSPDHAAGAEHHADILAAALARRVRELEQLLAAKTK
jgi:hypothetical protein